MFSRKVCLMVICAFLAGCTSLKKIQNSDYQEDKGIFSISSYCDTIKKCNSVFIGKIGANIELMNEQYETNVSLYYIPDSIIFATAVNAGFEIVRMGIYKDSIILINRLEKQVYIIKANDYKLKGPVNFGDLEILMNRTALCKNMEYAKFREEELVIDISENNANKLILFDPEKTRIKGFEFFQKLTGEYVVGEITGNDTMIIYVDYILNDVKIMATGGKIEYNRHLEVNLNINRNKYEIHYL